MQFTGDCTPIALKKNLSQFPPEDLNFMLPLPPPHPPKAVFFFKRNRSTAFFPSWLSPFFPAVRHVDMECYWCIFLSFFFSLLLRLFYAKKGKTDAKR